MFLLWHPSLTAINLSYTFPILETSATALCGTIGISYCPWTKSCINLHSDIHEVTSIHGPVFHHPIGSGLSSCYGTTDCTMARKDSWESEYLDDLSKRFHNLDLYPHMVCRGSSAGLSLIRVYELLSFIHIFAVAPYKCLEEGSCGGVGGLFVSF